MYCKYHAFMLKQQYMSLCLKKNNLSLCQKQKHVFMSKSPNPPLLQSFLKKIAKKFGGIK